MNIYLAGGYRERTISDYRMFWAEFIKTIDRQLIIDVTKEGIRKYVNHLLKERELSPVRAIFNRLKKKWLSKIIPLWELER